MRRADSSRTKPSRAASHRRGLVALGWTVLALGAAGSARAVTEQIWLDYNASVPLSRNVDLFGDLGWRHSLDGLRWWRLVVRPGVSVPAGNFRLTAGIGNFVTFVDQWDDRWEIRPYQGVAASWPRGKITLDHYLRLEQIFNFNTVTWRSVNSLRLRYQLQLSYRWDMDRPPDYWRAAVALEPFVVLASEEDLLEKKARATLAVERSLGADRRLRFEVIWQQATYFFLPGEPVRELYFRLRWYRRW